MAGNAEFPYTPVPESLKRLLVKIPSIGVPEKADAKWLAGLGFGGGNNQVSLSLMKKVGILDTAGKPTDFYLALRAGDKAKVGAGVRNAYPALFALYPDAHRQDDEALIAFARARTDYAAGVQRLAVRTFRVFTDFGDFDGAPAATRASAGGEKSRSESSEPGNARRSSVAAGVEQSKIALTVNIQLQLPPSGDGELYDKLFASMAKHLKGLVSLG